MEMYFLSDLFLNICLTAVIMCAKPTIKISKVIQFITYIQEKSNFKIGVSTIRLGVEVNKLFRSS